MQAILKYLKDHGEKLDSEIATGTGIPLAEVRRGVSDLSAIGEVITCHVIRFNNGKKCDGILYRAAGYIPPAAPGRKSKAQARVSSSDREAE